MIVIKEINTPIGIMLAGATMKGICFLKFANTATIASMKNKYCLNKLLPKHNKLFQTLSQQLIEYFNKTRKTFDIPLEIQGTKFQHQSWQALQTIPYGTTISYQEQAYKINQEKAIRAIATANKNNKINIIIPCHRVIGKNGNLTGYNGGIWRKKYY